MEILRELESAPRDAYCGAIGWIAPGGTMRFSVAIRTISLFPDGEAVYNVGGGVVFDSTAEEEYAGMSAEGALRDGNAAGFELIETMRWEPDDGFPAARAASGAARGLGARARLCLRAGRGARGAGSRRRRRRRGAAARPADTGAGRQDAGDGAGLQPAAGRDRLAPGARRDAPLVRRSAAAPQDDAARRL